MSETEQLLPEISEAEKRRQRRRERILGNTESRLQRIVSGTRAGKDVKVERAEVDPEAEDENVSSSFGIRTLKDPEIEMPRKRVTRGGARSLVDQPETTSLRSTDDVNPPSPQVQTSRRESISGNRDSVSENVSFQSKRLPSWVGRAFVCFLGVILSAFNAKYFLVTFFSWEVAFLGMNGLPPSPPPGIFILAVTVMGLKEPHLHRLRFVTQVLNCVITDLSFFIISALVPKALLHPYYSST